MVNHIAFIMDGNGRWATRQGLPRIEGHTRGGHAANTIMKACCERKIPYVTFYALSVQNWNRPKKELTHILNCARDLLKEMKDWVLSNNVKVKCIGIRKYIPSELLEHIEKLEEETSSNTGTQISICISYGGREEILEVFKAIDKPLDSLTTSNISTYFPLPDVDLVVRTSGEFRISNFLLWESAYAEYYFTQTCWPDFSVEEMDKAITEFESRNRRFGDIKSNEIELPEISTVIECLEELCQEYDQEYPNIVELYKTLSKTCPPIPKYNSVDNRESIREHALSSNGIINLSFKLDDVIDSKPIDEQIRLLKVLASGFNIENVNYVLDRSTEDYIDSTPEERMSMQRIYECEVVQRCTSHKFTARSASMYYYNQMVSKDMISDELKMIGSLILAFCDDRIDEKDELEELKYINERVKRIVSGAIFDFRKKAEHSQYRDKLSYVAVSLLLETENKPTSLSQCIDYILKTDV
jgi:undecaprenyl diphosphate synthase